MLAAEDPYRAPKIHFKLKDLFTSKEMIVNFLVADDYAG
jgi:hypothetical protein